MDGLLSELDEYAVEQALQISENSDDDVEVTVLTVGPEDAKDALRKALSMGRWCWRRRSRRPATTW